MNKTEKSRGDFQKSLNRMRKERGLTQLQVADALGISDKTYSKWECGETEPSLSSILALAELFEVSPAAFFTESDAGELGARIEKLYSGLSLSEAIDKAFELEFHAIRELAKTAFDSARRYDDTLPAQSIPENRVNPRNSHAITAYALPGVYHMMYNGDDANLALALMPNREGYGWLKSERERLSRYLSLVGNTDFLGCLVFMLDRAFADRYTAEYLAKAAGLEVERVQKLLCECVELGICSVKEAYIGERTVDLYRTEADQMLIGILTLAHLSLPEAEKNGCYYANLPARRIMVSGAVK